MSNLYRELTAREKQAVRRLVISECANHDHEYGCLPLDGACYMFTIAFAGSSLCKWFQNEVLPLDPALEAVFSRKPLKACKRCGRKFPVNGRQAYCEACAVPARKASAAARVRKHRAGGCNVLGSGKPHKQRVSGPVSHKARVLPYPCFFCALCAGKEENTHNDHVNRLHQQEQSLKSILSSERGPVKCRRQR